MKDQAIICNEFCGIGHHNMVGKIYVRDGVSHASTAHASAEVAP